MAIYTCECVIPRAYQTQYDIFNDDSLGAFQRWVGKSISNALIKKYGKAGLSAIPRHEILEEDLGLIQDCDFRDQPDGSIHVSFFRECDPHD